MAPASRAKHRVLLTGATGFVGFRAARRLLSLGHDVRSLARRRDESGELTGGEGARFEERLGDFADPDLARAAGEGCDVVIHCAATAGPDLDAVRRVNTEGTRSMIAAARAAGALRYVQISTVSVYDFSGLNGGDLDEATPLCTEGDPYGVTKAEGDRLVLDAATQGLPAIILRPGAILGLHPTSTWAVKVPRRIRDGAAMPARDPASTHPSVHVEDLVDAMLLALAADPLPGAARVYNAVSHNGTWGGYLEQVRAWFGLGPTPVPEGGQPASGRTWNGRVLSERIRHDLRWAPARSYADGMLEAETQWVGGADPGKRNS